MNLKKRVKLTNRGVLRTLYYEEVPEADVKRKIGDRALLLNSSVAENTDGQVIDANEVSMDRFDRVISVGIAEFVLNQDADNPYWDETMFPWIDANNETIMISLRQAIELQKDGLAKLASAFING